MLSLDEFKQKYYYSQATPMLQQYLDIKYQHQNCLLLFRVGDFYELFFDDAIATSKILGIALARKGKHAGEDLPMCGVPYHALELYLPRLVENGYKVAICEQFETPEEAKKRGGYKAVVQRKVVRIITSGTITEDAMIQSCAPNYLASLLIEKDIASIAYCDVSTTEFMIVDVELHSLCSELARINPREILLSESVQKDTRIINMLVDYQQRLVYQVESYFSCNKAKRIIHDYYGIATVNSIGTLSNVQISVIGAILEYLNITLKDSKSKLPLPQIISHKSMMLIDASARKSLELVTTLNGSMKGSLFSIIDATVTNQGSRLLHKFVTTPLAEVNAINYRLEMTDFFFNNMDLSINLRKIIKSVPDIERSLGRILIGKYNPKDLGNIKIALELSMTIKEEFIRMLGLNIPQTIDKIYYPLSGDDELYNLLNSALLNDLPNNINEGGFIKSNYHPKIMELRNLVGNSTSLVEKLKQKYRKETSIDTLKISHNNICGLFVEVNSKHVQKVTDPKFIHKQTTANAVRFVTNELQSLDAEMQSAKTIILALEQEILTELCEAVCLKSQIIANIAKSISLIDIFCSFAYIAHENNYCRPIVTDDCSFNITLGRHPVVEQGLNKKHENFVANDCDLQDKQKIWLITGPNMAGKSTFLRQNALIAILAQIGSYVPATSAHIGVVDKLFSRIGAADDLASGQSTFMIEMVETSVILAQSTAKSLVILDEIGRGTSTYDGISIAWSCLEYIHNHIKCRCLFATHYHELVNISQELQSLQNFTIAINDKEDKLSFLYKIITGAANKSYGINVAEFAGLPKQVLSRARNILSILESKTQDCQKIDTYSDHANNVASSTMAPYSTYPTKTMEMIKCINPDQLTPKEALEIVYQIKEISLSES